MSFIDKIMSLLNGNKDYNRTTTKVEPVPTLTPKKATNISIDEMMSEFNKTIDNHLSNVGTSTCKTQKEDFSKIIVMLDNGHGEETPGKRSPDGRLREYAYTREIVKMIKEDLDKTGIECFIVTPETKDIKLTTRANRANKKKESMGGSKTAIFISVHCNAASNSGWYTARGWSAWTTRGVTKSDKLADCLYEAAHQVLDPKGIKIRKDMSDGDEDWESDFTVIKKADMPAVLTENFFQDNKEDVEYLLSDEGKNDVVKIHVDGIKRYYRKYINKK